MIFENTIKLFVWVFAIISAVILIHEIILLVKKIKNNEKIAIEDANSVFLLFIKLSVPWSLLYLLIYKIMI